MTLPVLTAEEIAQITPRNCGARDVERLLATIAAKDREIAELRQCSTCYGQPHASGVTCICGGTNRGVEEIAGLRYAVHELESKLREAEADREALLGMGEPWPLKDVLTTLADFARKELRDNSRDFHGHESVSTCIQRAMDIVEGIDWNHLAALQDAKEKW